MDSAATERVGRYQLLEPIGIGPNGTVSRAKVFGVAGFERQFAVKRFFPELTITATMAQTLSQAARGYGGLEHPRIARMAEFGVAGGTTYTAVELVTGLDALRLINETRLAGLTLPVGGALGLVSQAARAVGYAHGRGLAHLGLAPTNVIVSADGDVKITDFNILQATLPVRAAAGPWQDGPIGGLINGRLANRVMYLAPEQIAGESTSAATDVWGLGVLAYELVTGQRAFRGDSPAAIANAVMSSTPTEPPLPRPSVRVLQRCLARSPFERFPDARALADAIDAAIRVAPVPGTRKDLGALVGEILDRIAALHDGQMSGMLGINLGTGPIRREAMPEIATLGRATDQQLELSTGEFVRPDLAVPGPAPLIRPTRSSDPGLPKIPSTMAGIPAPPIPPVPAKRPTNPPPIPTSATLLGLPAIPRMASPSKFPLTAPATAPGVTPAPPTRPTPYPRAESAEVTVEAYAPEHEAHETHEAHEAHDEARDEAPPPPRRARTNPETVEMSPRVAQQLGEASMLPTSEIEPLARSAREEIQEAAPHEVPPPRAAAHEIAPREMAPHEIAHAPTSTAPDARRGNKLVWLFGGLIVLGGLGFVGWQLYDVMKTDEATPVVAKTPGDAAEARDAAKVAVAPLDAALPADASKLAVVRVPIDAARPAPPDAAQVALVADAAIALDAAKVASVVADAGVADAARVASVPVDAAVAVPVPTGDGSSLVIDSTPHGARVFVDGKDAGLTPVKLAATAAKHNVSLILAGHDLYVAAIDGKGSFTIPLVGVPAWKGNAGIKVLKCADKDRYYVYVDGKPTGMTCPTERINTVMGPHTVEVYDAHTDAKKKWDVTVPDERLSLRVRVEP